MSSKENTATKETRTKHKKVDCVSKGYHRCGIRHRTLATYVLASHVTSFHFPRRSEEKARWMRNEIARRDLNEVQQREPIGFLQDQTG
ncbi:hypothetical protein GWI33_014288 [Rhynchophorus ferrugineus]|uniref:Uncharacterized protein n=1 Tax=Rhynchophorus ferrugineus TaxID=354439 RepID=A0A834I7N1_RHYFE|nr:hypothetical protein GWI33_014288 [Rhynchophorus ferrugineus]